MKKIIVATLVSNILIVAITHGQITKRNWMLGGSIGYSSTETKNYPGALDQTNSEINIKPNVGYFIANKVATGIKLSFSHKKSSLSFSKYDDFNVGPYIRYYFLPVDKMVNIIAEGNYLYGYAGGTSAAERSGKNTFSFTGGSVVFLNSSVGLEFLINYSTSSFFKNEVTIATIQFGLGLQVHLEKE